MVLVLCVCLVFDEYCSRVEKVDVGFDAREFEFVCFFLCVFVWCVYDEGKFLI